MDALSMSIGLGLLIGFFYSERMDLGVGGYIVHGYFAIQLHNPLSVVSTIGISLVCFFIIEYLSHISVVYGKRRAILTILLGYTLGMIWNQYVVKLQSIYMIDTIGFIIPGLIAQGFQKQGIITTLSSLTIVSVLVRILLIFFLGMELGL